VRILDAVAHSGTGREIEDDVELSSVENGLEVIKVLNVTLVESESFASRKVGEAVLFEAEIVGVVEIVYPDDLNALLEEEPGDPMGDKAGSAGDEDGSS